MCGWKIHKLLPEKAALVVFRSQRCCDGLLLKLQIADVLESDSTVPSIRVCVWGGV